MNKITLIGNLTRDPEVSTTPSGVTLCRFGIAVNRRYQGQDGERVTDFFNIVTWRGLAETCAKFLAKGRKIAVIGEMQTRSYKDKNGDNRVAYEVSADEVEFLTPKGEQGSSQERYSPAPTQGQGGEPAPVSDGFVDVDDDTLPF